MVNSKQLCDPIAQAIPNRIVFTGGPLGGKSTIMEYLKGAYGHRARFMTEVASMLLTNGYPKPGDDVAFSDEWLDYINETIIPTQLAMENGHLHAAVENKKRAVFFDRGLLDPAAYVPNGRETLIERYGFDIKAMQNRYSMVIHLQSLACADKAEYNRLCSSNPARYDTADMAVIRDSLLKDAWSDHPNWIFIPAHISLEEKISQVLRQLNPILDVEIERKFLILNVPHDILMSAQCRRIEQFYVLRENKVEMRVRSYDNTQFELCVKDNEMEQRMEWETQIPSQVFDAIAYNEFPAIIKKRYYIPYGAYTLELDIYGEHLVPDLCILECEFANENEAKSFVLPDWAASAIDVTQDPAYKNAALAKPLSHLM